MTKMTGNQEEDLFDALKALDENTALDNILKPGQTITISAQRESGKLKNWRIVDDPTALNFKPYKTGSAYGSFTDALANLHTEDDVTNEINVICYYDTAPERTWDGLYTVKMFIISPSEPFNVNASGIELPTLKLDVSESDYKLIRETGLGFYNEVTGDVYPIREIAISSIGKLMDCAASFKYMTTVPLGSALLLAEKLGNTRGVQFIYRNRHGRFKPLVGVGGDRFIMDEQQKFFREVLDHLAEVGMYTIAKWSISDELTSVEVEMHGLSTLFSPRIKIITSDIPGVSISATAYAQMGKGKIFLGKNKAYHTKRFACEEMKSLFDGLFEKFQCFNDKLESGGMTRIGEEHLLDIKRLLGKKRALRVDFSMTYTGNATEVIQNVINNTYFELPVKQAEELAVAYRDVVERVI